MCEDKIVSVKLNLTPKNIGDFNKRTPYIAFILMPTVKVTCSTAEWMMEWGTFWVLRIMGEEEFRVRCVVSDDDNGQDTATEAMKKAQKVKLKVYQCQ